MKGTIGALLSIGLLILVVVPLVLTSFVNSRLNEIETIEAKVGWIWVNPLTLSLKAENTFIAAEDQSFKIRLPSVNAAFDGSELLRLRIKASITLYSPETEIHRISKPSTPKDKSKVSVYGIGLKVRKILPAVLEALEIQHGKFLLVSNSQVFGLHEINLEVNNVPTRRRQQDGASVLKLRAITPGSGQLNAFGTFDPLDPWPSAKLEFKINRVQLPELAKLTRELVNVEAEKGSLDITGEVATARGKIEGYVKPLISHLDVTGNNTQQDGWKVIWEKIVQGFASIFKNDDTNKVAGIIRFKGDLTQPGVDMWETALSIFENAFLQGLGQDYERSISLNPRLPQR